MKNGTRNTKHASRNSRLPISPKISPLRRLHAMHPKAERMNKYPAGNVKPPN
jgi:hypothetical protein